MTFHEIESILIKDGKLARRDSWEENLAIFVKYSHTSLAIKDLKTGEYKKYIPTKEDLDANDWRII